MVSKTIEDALDYYKQHAPADLYPVAEASLVLGQETDRGAVLVAASFIEGQLGEVIKGFLIHHGAVKDLMSGSMGAPLQSFGSRISMAFSLGLITEKERDDCTIIRKIRNKFAHQVTPAFTEKSIIDLSANLRLGLSELNVKDADAASQQFKMAAANVFLRLHERVKWVVSQRRQILVETAGHVG
ncbi:hypothetical protein NOJ28_11175 [Neorhizobium galegae]|uniref:hypothetical protein n=1 Tax=Neorhizobium galegae TaxID=399 RepID=UPI0021078417|nr:hypothetical protein [Neorhizobium galegae]MCQ1766097.1 hypothetical protein [Neorhizobium galegae]MCQ1845011.1 hypothetical protein [Neorhizobium galegae]